MTKNFGYPLVLIPYQADFYLKLSNPTIFIEINCESSKGIWYLLQFI